MRNSMTLKLVAIIVLSIFLLLRPISSSNLIEDSDSSNFSEEGFESNGFEESTNLDDFTNSETTTNDFADKTSENNIDPSEKVQIKEAESENDFYESDEEDKKAVNF